MRWPNHPGLDGLLPQEAIRWSGEMAALGGDLSSVPSTYVVVEAVYNFTSRGSSSHCRPFQTLALHVSQIKMM